ncbi:anaerobic c4-dicarboxylate antiporter, DcuC family [Thermosinus carboxydivorans Nor1]|uniref:Anaerobic c4-dicarboxylate antiporter, DcuC family n=1 Tax=Thermosinus carboxydivorans Nor1 TaxID=401526 RepID=A1HLW4_9FIRM|nr:C4-dicarboxylate transporter DcuC [Thermosinus carboxydivorans]EAX48817.1 anaerobic c4-dicarboxylate antiporter, DcuC family [Thermosinus carboxydivorans Nor1]
MGIVISLIVTFWVGYLITRKYKPQPVLFMAGLILMFCGVALGLGAILPAKNSTGSVFFDAFEFIKQTFSSRAAGLGLNIMAVGGFARYMDHIGASKALVRLTIRPLLALRAPYLVMAASWVVGMLLGLCINSASGLAMLLMVTLFPVLVSLGVSRLSATAVIATTLCLDWSPSDTGTILSAQTAGLDPVLYWTNYQIPIALTVMPVVAGLHYFTQKWMDKRDGHEVVPIVLDKTNADNDEECVPMIYAILPTLPLALILIFSNLWISWIKMDIIKAMFIGVFIAMIFEYVRTRDGKKVLDGIQSFFDGLGMQMANVITLIVAGETFAKGLTTIGTIDAIIKGAQTSGFGATGMILVMVGIIAGCSIVMGSGNAPFFAFASLTPTVAAKMGVAPVLMLLPMHFAASIARSVSPITAVIVVSSSMGGVSPFDLVKRTAIPMAGAMLVNVIGTFVYFYR